ncbi:olfactory receptor 5J3-like [Morphnus guianensis]
MLALITCWKILSKAYENKSLSDVKMAVENCTEVTQFTFSGLTEHPQLKPVLFALFLGTYVLTLVGNLGLIALIRVSPQLHTPMYFFLGNLSFLDICYSSTISPKMLLDFPAKNKVISFAGCLTQLYFYTVFATAEIYLLAAMAHDRYVAISKPLLYKVVMSPGVCTSLVAGSYLAGLLNAIVHTSALLRLSFCGPLVIDNFYCDGPPLFVVASTDTRFNEGLMFVFVGFNMMTTILLILTSYACIVVAVGRMGSAAGRRKACSTCASHLAAIIIFYVSATFNYMQPSSSNSLESKKIASIFYTIIVPMLNPMIYSLRNKEVKHAFSSFVQDFVELREVLLDPFLQPFQVSLNGSTTRVQDTLNFISHPIPQPHLMRDPCIVLGVSRLSRCSHGLAPGFIEELMPYTPPVIQASARFKEVL